MLIASYVLLCAFLRIPEAPPVDDGESETEDVSEEPEPGSPQCVSVGGVTVSVGDRSGVVMGAFRNELAAMPPLVERNEAARACHVVRAYQVGQQRITLTMERSDSAEPLLLSRIDIAE